MWTLVGELGRHRAAGGATDAVAVVADRRSRSPGLSVSGCSSSASRSLRTDMASLWRRAVDLLRQRDPEFDALRRAARAAIVVPIAAAVGFAVGSWFADTDVQHLRLGGAADPGGLSRKPPGTGAGLLRSGCQRSGPDHPRHAGGRPSLGQRRDDVRSRCGGDVLRCAQRDRRRGPARHAADVRAAGVHAGRSHSRAPARLAHRAGGVRARGVVPLRAAPSRRIATSLGAGVHRAGRSRWRAPERPRT